VGGTSPSLITASQGGGINLTVNVTNAQRTFDVADVTGDANVDLTISAVLDNSVKSAAAAGLIKAGAGTMDLRSTNIYTGATTINGGSLLVDGSIGSGNVTVSGGVLGGGGLISGAVAVQANGTVQPGLGGVDTSTLTINNTLTLAGNTVFVLNRTNTQPASRISGITTLNQGGTLTVTNVGDPLQSGDAFTLFNASTYANAFAATNLPALFPGLSWSNSLSGTAFTMTVIGQIKTPNISKVSVSGGHLIVSGANGMASQPYRIFTSTNVASPMSEWMPVTTNIFAADGGYTSSIPVNTAANVEFFRVVEP